MSAETVAPIEPVRSLAEGQALAERLLSTMSALVTVVEEETALVRAGKLFDADRLNARKTDLSRSYVADVLRMKTGEGFFAQFAPALLARLKKQHEAFRALLQKNLTVLATAHAVSEGIVRGVSGELTRRAAPQTYGASGRYSAPSPRAATPLAVSRTL